MNPNVRVAIILAVYAVLGLAAWHFLAPGEKPSETAGPAASVEQTDGEAAPAMEVAPREIVTPAPLAVSSSSTSAASAGPAGKSTAAAAPEKAVRLLSGKVVDAAGQAVGDALISIVSLGEDAGGAAGIDEMRRETTSASDGTFKIERVPATRFAVLASKDGLTCVRVANTLNADDTTVDIVLDVSGSIAGRVVNKAGEPVAGAEVLPVTSEPVNNQFPMRAAKAVRTLSAEDGSFEVAGLSLAHSFKLAARLEGFAPAVSDLIAPGAQNVELVITLGGAMAGEVVDVDTRAPLPNVKVAIDGPHHGAAVKAISDEEGRFKAALLAPGTFKIDLREDETFVVSGEPIEIDVAEDQETAGVQVLVTRGGTVSGRVYDKDSGKGVAGIELNAYGDGSHPSRKATTDGDGNFTLAGMADANYTVQPTGEISGYGRFDWEDRKVVKASPGRDVPGIDFPLEKGVRIAGRAVDDKGAGVAGADVRIESRQQRVGGHTKTEANGSFVAWGFTAGAEVFIKGVKAELASTTLGPLTVPEEGLNDVLIAMGPESVIAGSVVDQNGRAVKEGNVIAFRVPHDAFGSPHYGIDGQGRFEIKGLAAGSYELMASRGGNFSGNRTNVAIEAGERRDDVTLTIEEGGEQIAGVVVDSKGAPIAGASLNAYGNSDGGQSQTQSGDDGRFTLTGLKEGTYHINAYHHAHSQLMRQNVAAPERNLRLVMLGKGTVEGVVLGAGGQPVAQFEILAVSGRRERLDPWMESNFVQIRNEQGQFTLADVDAGENTLVVRATGYAVKTDWVEVREHDSTGGLTIRLEPGGLVEGRVVNEAGAPVAGATIWDGATQPHERQWATPLAKSDAQGAFTIPSLSPGNHTLAADHPSYAPGTRELIVAANQTTPVEIVLGSGGVVEGRVTIGGRPAVQANVSVNAASFNKSAQVGEDGAYRVTGVPVGEFTVHAGFQSDANNPRGYRNARRTAFVEADRVTEVHFDFIDANAAVEGYVRAGNLTLQGGARVIAEVTASDGVTEHYSTELDANGYYRLDMIPGAVALRVWAQLQDGASVNRNFDINAAGGQVVRQDIDLTGGASVVGTVAGWSAQLQGNVAVFSGRVELPAQRTMDYWQNLYNRNRPVANAPIGADGSFRVAGLAPGEYSVLVAAYPNIQNQSPEAMFAAMRIDLIDIVITGEEEVTINADPK